MLPRLCKDVIVWAFQNSMLAPFGSPCYIKTKRDKTGAVEDLGPKWTRWKHLVGIASWRTVVDMCKRRTSLEPPPLKDVAPPLVAEPNWRLRTKTAPAELMDHPGPPAESFCCNCPGDSPRRRRLKVKTSPAERNKSVWKNIK